MNTEEFSRRSILKKGLAFGAGLSLIENEAIAKPKKNKTNFTYSLNTSTIQKQNLGLMGELDLVAKAGYNGIEIWMRTLDTYLKGGGKLSDVKKKASDLGIVIEDSIGFAAWIVDEEGTREKALDQIKREMEMLAQIGCKRMAAPPVGATAKEKAGLSLFDAAKRYKKVCELGDQMGVKPMLEMWGHSANLHLFGEALYVASECGHHTPLILADVFHLHKGGSELNAINLVAGKHIEVFHMNDYPDVPGKTTINDSYRVMPGDGVAPMTEILGSLKAKNTPIVLSVELFNESYWKMDALEVAKIGLDKMKACVSKVA
jgi:2-keto-myo-inositol isomerase